MPDEYPEPETVALARREGLKLVEYGVSMNARTSGKSMISGMKTAIFMYKVLTALLGLRLRTLLP
jgi:hypothetical protein